MSTFYNWNLTPSGYQLATEWCAHPLNPAETVIDPMQVVVKFPQCGNPADNCVSVEFTIRGNMTNSRDSATAETLRIHEFKECVSAKPQLRKRNVHTCLPQRLLKFPFAEIRVSVKNPSQKRKRKSFISPCNIATVLFHSDFLFLYSSSLYNFIPINARC